MRALRVQALVKAMGYAQSRYLVCDSHIHMLPHAATFNQVEYLPSHDWSRCHGMLKQVQAFLAGVNEVDIVLERPHLPGHAVPGAGGAGGGGGGDGEEDEAFSSRHTALQHVNLVRRLLNLQ